MTTADSVQPVPTSPPPTPAASEPAQPKRVSMPPEPTDKLRLWLGLIVTLGLCAIPLLIELRQPDTTFTMEKITLASARETWGAIRAGERDDAWLVPTWNGRPRTNKPPLAVWMTIGSWMDLSPPPADADIQTLHRFNTELVWRARLASGAMALIALAATYWAGYSVGGVRTAIMAALATGTMLLFIRQGRLASYDTYLLGWVTLSVACGLWAMRPLRPIHWVGRRVIGWAFAGLALGAAVMSKGPLAAAWVVVPLATTIIVTPSRKLGNVIGLLFALLAGALLAAPWYLYVLEHYPQATETMQREFVADRSEAQPFYYYLLLAVLVFPWSVYLIGALFQPFVRARGEHRRRTLIGWLWFVVMLGIMSMVEAKQDRYIVPLLPAAGILVGQLWSYHAHLADEGLKDPGVNLLRVPHWLMLLGGAIALPAFIIYQPELIQRGWIEEFELPGLAWYVAVTTGAAMGAAAILGAIWHWRWKPRRAFGAGVAWMLIASSVTLYSYARSHHGIYEHRGDAERVLAAIDDLPLYFLYDPAQDAAYDPQTEGEEGAPGRFEPEEEFIFYTGRIVKPVRADELAQYVNHPCYVMLRLDEMETNVGRLMSHGFVAATDDGGVINFSDGREVAGLTPPRARLFASPAVASIDQN